MNRPHLPDTHACLYRAWDDKDRRIVHTPQPTLFLGTGRTLYSLLYGTTRAISTNIPCVRSLTKGEVESAYEYILVTLLLRALKTWILRFRTYHNHGPFLGVRRNDCRVSRRSYRRLPRWLSPSSITLRFGGTSFLQDKHCYMRKHGQYYYGQG